MRKIKVRGEFLAIEINRKIARLARVSCQKRAHKLVCGVTVEMPNDVIDDGKIINRPLLFSTLSEALAENKALLDDMPRRVIFILSTSRTYFSYADIPNGVTSQGVERYLHANDDIYFPLGLDGGALSFEAISKPCREFDRTEYRAYRAWATPKDILEEYYLLAEELGLRVIGIEHIVNAAASYVGVTFSSIKEELHTSSKLYIRADEEHIILMLALGQKVKEHRIIKRSFTDEDFNEAKLAYEYLKMSSDNILPAASSSCFASGPAFIDKDFTSKLMECIPLYFELDGDSDYALCVGAADIKINSGITDRPYIISPRTAAAVIFVCTSLLCTACAYTAISLFSRLDERAALNKEISELELYSESIPSHDNEISSYEDYVSDSETLDSLSAGLDEKIISAVYELTEGEICKVKRIDADRSGTDVTFVCDTLADAALLLNRLCSFEYASLESIDEIDISSSGSLTVRVLFTFDGSVESGG